MMYNGIPITESSEPLPSPEECARSNALASQRYADGKKAFYDNITDIVGLLDNLAGRLLEEDAHTIARAIQALEDVSYD